MISVIVPLYNKESTILKALESVVQQTYTDFEVLVIDDGSTDQSSNRVKSLTDPRVKLLQKNNGGAGSARNFGIEHAARPILAFLDADDEWESNFLERIVALSLDFPEADFFGTALRVYSVDGNLVDQRICVPPPPWRGYLNYFKSASCGLSPLSASSVAMRRELQRRVGLFDCRFSLGEDLEYWCRLQLAGKLAYDSTPLARYYQGQPNSATLNARPSEEVVVSPSTTLVLCKLANNQISPQHIEDALMYVEARFLSAIQGCIANRNQRQALVLLRLCPRGFFRLKHLFYSLLAHVPIWLLDLALKVWARRPL